MLTLLLIGMLTLASNIQLGKADWTWTETIYIRADGSVYPSSAPISTVDNVIYTLTDNIVGAVAESSSAIVVERSNVIIDGKGKTVQGTGAHLSKGISLTSMNNVTIKGTNIKGFFFGISLASSLGNCISGNNITVSNFHGIWLYYSSDNSISENNITANNGDGIELYNSSGNNISGNNVGSHMYGIWLYSSSGNCISRNNIANSWHGIRLEYYSSDNSISGNNITANKYDGINLASSSGNSISGNNITANNDSGIYLESSSDNSIYHNNFIDNINQASSYNSLNAWDDGYPSGGNYWNDYVDADERSGPNQDEPGKDGIWDHAYVVGWDNEDRYPLVNRWVPRTVGVQVGDWVKYSVEIVGYRPGFPVDLNDVEWGKTVVQAILGTTIEVELLWHLKNGTEITTTGTVDVVTSGYPGPTSMTGLFVSKDLPVGATLYATYPFGAIPPSLKINETVFKEYLGVSRETNRAEGTKGVHIDAYWDKATGILSELNEDYEGYFTWSLRFEIVDTNLWEAPIISAAIDIDSDFLNLWSKGRWITAYIQLPEGYSAEDIDASTILLNGTIAPVLDYKYGFVTNASEYLIDHNGDGVLERIVKLDRATLVSWIYQNIGMRSGISLTITGKLFDGISFEGTDTISVLWTGRRAPFKR